jgi:hypothetical protein
VTLEAKHPVVLIGGTFLVFAGLAALGLWALPGTRHPFEFLVAGTFATTASLLVFFALFLKRQL